ncbi:MAG TPA: PIG-L family deacetylase, partial [Terriglobales bacterium]
MRRALLLIGIAAVLVAQAPAPRQTSPQPTVASRQLAIDRGAAAVWQSLKKLHTRASLLLVVAHPDDEDGGMLTALARGQGVRATLLTLNRGEGGENLMSDDFYDGLGLVRTQELLAADRYYGVNQYFTRVVDFGFSKTEAETLKLWGHDRVLGDAVRVVRMTRPLVVASVFVGGPSDGHGNHAASGEIAQEVYNAAGDPKMFPEQIQAGLRPWNPLKVYARVPVGAFTDKGIYDSASQVYAPGRVFDYVHQSWIEGQPSITLRVNESGYDPLLGSDYVQLARQGLDQQKSQNGGIGIPDPGPASTPYHLYASRVKTGAQENSYFDGVDTSLMGIADLGGGNSGSEAADLKPALAAINHDVEQAIAEFSASAPEKIAPLLAHGLAATNALAARVAGGSLSAEAKYDIGHELSIKQAQFQAALCEALGLSLSAVVGGGGGGRGGPAATFANAIPGQKFTVQTHVADSGSVPVDLAGVSLSLQGSAPITSSTDDFGTLAPRAEKPISTRFEVTIPENASYTRPYFNRPNTEQPYYNIVEPKDLNLPTAPYPLAATARFRFDGVEFAMAQVVQTVERVNGAGVVENPLVIAPAISVSITPHAGIVPLPAHALDLAISIHSNVKGPAEGNVTLRLPSGWTATPQSAPFNLAHDGEDQPISFHIQPNAVTTDSYTITAVAHYNGLSYEEGYKTVGYTGLRPSNLYAPAAYLTRGVHVTIAGQPGALNVGYVTGTGDNVPQSLENLGVHAHFLGPRDLAGGDLHAYDAIVLGIRAYAARPDLVTNNGRLLEYVKQGGVVIVQYET